MWSVPLPATSPPAAGRDLPPAIETRRLTRAYGTAPVLRGLDLRIAHGTVFGLLGPNGAGKTTLVRILATLLLPDEGTASVLGHDVVTERRAVRSSIGLAGQDASIDGLLTGEENLIQLARLLRFDRRSARRRAGEMLERFDLTDAGHVRVDQYSGGMRRRLDLAASLLARPAVLFLDEPTTGLDPRSRRTLWGIIDELADEGTTILLTTQYLEEADHLAERIGVLDRGRLVVEGTPAELKRRVGQERLTLTVEHADLDRALAVLPAAGGDGDGRVGHVTLPLRDPDHLRELLTILASEGVSVSDLRVHAPTLDDVFLALTDRGDAEGIAA
jgi:ABC-2 type transport system ATP-binding protein